MKIFDGFLIKSGEAQAVKFAHGHIGFQVFAQATETALADVQQCYAGYVDQEGKELTGAWSYGRSQLCPEPITMVFV